MKLPEPYLPELMEQIDKYVQVPHEIIIHKEKGLSRAVRLAVEFSRGNIIAVLDADGQHDPSYLPFMLETLENGGYDLVLGSRYVEGGKDGLVLHRRLISKFFCSLAQKILNLKTHDAMTGYVVGKREIFEKLHVAKDSFKFVAELLCYTDNVCEVPIVMGKRKGGYSKVSFKQGIVTLRLLWKLRKVKNCVEKT